MSFVYYLCTFVLIIFELRQRSPISCLLFTIFDSDVIRVTKGNDHDGFLQWLHIVVLMDDTVILSLSRQSIVSKLSLVRTYCYYYGMVVNEAKTIFLEIDGCIADMQPLAVQGMIVEFCNVYVYLWPPFTSDGSTSSLVMVQAN